MKTTSRIQYDHASMWSPAVSHGTPESVGPSLLETLSSVHKKLKNEAASGRMGFMAMPDMKKELALAKRMAAAVKRDFKTLVVVGIGGSDLGARAVIHALKSSAKKGIDVRFIGANTDPDELAAFAAGIDWKKTAINVISKSGDTIEPMTVFLYLRQQLIKKVGQAKHAKHVIATTDEKTGTLRKIADLEGYRTLPVPGAIGGRFSVLTPVGLFPIACAGIDVSGLVAGAREERDAFLEVEALNNAPLFFAGLQWEAGKSRNQRITVLMPYSESLKEVGAWFRQLWAESLGKKLDRRGQIVYRGFTPVAALGATDQHSQIQLFNEGPMDKTITFIEVKKFANGKLKVPNAYPDLPGAAFMTGHTFEAIIHAERAATAQALTGNGRPNGTLTIPSVDAKSVGSLLFFFMLATAAAAELLDVNAYDQPGVESGKQAMHDLLGRSSR